MSAWKPIDTLKHHEWERVPSLFQIVLACFHVHTDEEGEPTGEVSLQWAHVVSASFDGKWMLNTAGWSGIYGNASFRIGDSRATHWMPLPALPETAGPDGEEER